MSDEAAPAPAQSSSFEATVAASAAEAPIHPGTEAGQSPAHTEFAESESRATAEAEAMAKAPLVPPGHTPEGEAPAEGAPAAEGEPTAEGEETELFSGLTQEAIMQAVKDGQVPPELMETMTIPVQINGETHNVPLAEAAKGHMRMADYSRNYQKLLDERGEFEGHRTGFDTMFDTWKDKGNADRTWREWEDLGIPVHDIAEAYANDFAAMEEMSPAQREALQRSRDTERKMRGMEAELSQMRANGTQKATSRIVQEAQQNHKRWGPEAFQANKIHNSPDSQRIYKGHLRTMWDETTPLTQQIVRDAAEATAQDLGEIATRYQAAQPAPPAPAPTLPVNPAPSGGGKSVQRGALQSNSFAAHMAWLGR